MVAVALVLSGCGGGSGSDSTVAAKPHDDAGRSAQVSRGSPWSKGPVLVDENGHTLYTFGKDARGSGRSACAGACAVAWPPLLTEGRPEVFGGALIHASMFGTIERGDGTTQVTYAGWPLYTYAKDQTAQINGVGKRAFGASWYPLDPAGRRDRG